MSHPYKGMTAYEYRKLTKSTPAPKYQQKRSKEYYGIILPITRAEIEFLQALLSRSIAEGEPRAQALLTRLKFKEPYLISRSEYFKAGPPNKGLKGSRRKAAQEQGPATETQPEQSSTGTTIPQQSPENSPSPLQTEENPPTDREAGPGP
jgi:hypothetical protein